jgi:hypothetical protein
MHGAALIWKGEGSIVITLSQSLSVGGSTIEIKQRSLHLGRGVIRIARPQKKYCKNSSLH